MTLLEQLLGLIAAGDAEAVTAFLAGLSADELTELEGVAETAAEERAPNAADATVAAELVALADAVTAVRTDGQRRADEAATNVATAEEALTRIRGEQAPPEGEPVEGEPVEPAEPAAPAGDEPPVEPEAVATQEPIAAAVAPRLSRVASRRPAPMAVAPPAASPIPDPENWGLVASANVSGFAAGEALDDPEKIARAFQGAIAQTAGFKSGRMKVLVARRGDENPANVGYTEDRILGRDAVENMRKLRRLASPAAITAAYRDNSLTAAGGICAPTPVRYDLPVIGTDERPFRDQAMQRFGADRGGVTTMPIPVLTDVDSGAVAAWTAANDAEPSDPATKPCLEVTCPTEDETLVDAITRCLQFGNFRARFYPEQIAAWMELVSTWHARFAESRLITTVGAGSTQVTFGAGGEAAGLGATPEVLAYLDRAGAGLRSRHRLPRDFPLQFAFPFWLLDMMRTDLARELPSGSMQERLAAAEATLLGFMRARNITPVPFLDGETGQIFGPQADGALNGWPDTVVTYLYPVGTWLFLDGGTLDLGIVRDSTLNSTNDVQMFAETFEQAHFHGVESIRGVLDLCPSGGTAATVDTTGLCATFS